MKDYKPVKIMQYPANWRNLCSFPAISRSQLYKQIFTS